MINGPMVHTVQAWLSLPKLPMCKTLTITLFSYNTFPLWTPE